MHRITLFLMAWGTVALLSTGSVLAFEPELLLAENGVSDYKIAISKEASPSECHAADELQMFLQKICGVRLPIITDEQPLGPHEIILGDSAHLRAAGIEIDFESLGDEGFVIRTARPHLVIAGGKERGTMYGVYAFLEERLGCRWFTSTVSHIPKIPKLAIGKIDDRQIPELEYREVFIYDALDADWSAHNRLNSSMGRLTEKHGGKIAYYPFVHSFFALIPPDKYFETHPEWFSLVDGKRTLVGRYKRTQLCLTNEDMIQQAIQTVREWIAEHPDANIISISQNDGPGGWCECENCTALEEKEGGAHSAPIIYFVNRIAEVMAKEHPNIAIDTLAYSYSRKAPKSLKPLPNVIIRLTSGGCGAHGIFDEQCDRNAGLRNDILDWFRLTKRIYIWDYVVNFHQYLLPFPNFQTFAPNIRSLIDHGVRGIFEQASGDLPHSDCAPLKAYLLAKLLWNPEIDRSRVTQEFLDAYYGPAGAPIGEYLHMLEQDVSEGTYMWYHMSPFERNQHPIYLKPEILAKATLLYDKAEGLVADKPELLERVERARLSLDYAKLYVATRVNALAGNHPEDTAVREWYQRTVNDFFATAERTGVDYMREKGRPRSSMKEFREDLQAMAEVTEGFGGQGE